MGGIIYYAPPNEPVDVWYPDSSGIKTFAEEQILGAIADRDNSLTNLYDALANLNTDLTQGLSLAPLSVDTSAFTVTIPPPLALPSEPVRPDLSTDFPAAPTEPTLGTVPTVTFSDVPTFDETAPDTRTITPPVPFNEAAPTSDPVPTRDFPDAPGYTLPVAPTARELTLPDAPSLLTINFEGVLPTNLDAPPDVDFNFTEAEYQSVLGGTVLKDKLLDLVLVRQMGIPEAVRQQLWARARENTAAEAENLIEAVTQRWAAAGFMMPQGDEANQVRQAEEKAIENDITENRSIAIAEAELEQKNFQFAFTQAIALEGQYMSLHNNVQQRAFDAAKYEIEAAIALYQIKVAYFNAGVTMYQTQAAVYRDRIQAELAKLEIYKAQLEGQKLISELNAQDIANYKAQIDAIVAIFELYKSELLAVKTQLEGDQIKIQQFEAYIRAYVAKIQAKSLEYEGYKSELQGEELKAKIYDILADAFGKRIQAYGTESDVKLKQFDADVKVNFEIPLEIYKEKSTVYKTQVEAKLAEIEGETKIYQTDADVYQTIAKARQFVTEADIARAEMELKQYLANIEALVKVFHENVLLALSDRDVLISARKTEAQLRAQIAAAIGSAVSFATHLSGTSSYPNAQPAQVAY